MSKKEDIAAITNGIDEIVSLSKEITNKASKLTVLRNLCVDFIKEQDITCAEDIYQHYGVAAHALEFIEKVAELVGYVSSDRDANQND